MIWANLAAWAMRWLAWIVVAVLAISILSYVAYRVFGDGPRHDAAVATATGAVSAAGTASAHDAVESVNGNAHTVTTIHDTTRIEHETIVKVPGASLPVSNELDAAGRHGICVLDPRTCDPDGK